MHSQVRAADLHGMRRILFIKGVIRLSEYRLEMHNVVKTFPGVKALDGAQLNLRPGTVHALMGENGAGKSTLMKCMFGIYHMDEGEVIYEGEKVQIKGPLDALMMRGNLQLLGGTNVTYVMKDSPLTVQDRLSDLVTFTSFEDTLVNRRRQEAPLPLGGLDMLLTIRIDQSVRLNADITPEIGRAHV